MMKQDESSVPIVDRLTGLPEHIKHDILSRLETKDAVRTSVLSRNWRHEWNWLPCLRFNKQLLPFDSEDEEIEQETEPETEPEMEQDIFKKKVSFLKFVDQALRRRSTKGLFYILEKLSLYVPISHAKVASHVDLWLACAVKCGVRRLHLFVAEDKYIYRFPERFFEHAFSLTLLKLTQCMLKLENPCMVRLSNLQELSLNMVYVDEKTIEGMIASCGAIKKLRFVHCSGFNKLKISGAPKLEKVKIITDELQTVVIDAMNLQTFNLESGYPPRVVDVNVATCKSIRRLKLHGIAITNGQLCFHLSMFQFLEDLWLICCDSLTRIRISAPNLKNLTMHSCKELNEAEIDAQNLESIFCSDMLCLSLNAPRLISAIVSLTKLVDDDWWYSLFLTFLTNFNLPTTTLSLIDIPEMRFYVPRRIRRMFVPPLWKVEHVELPMELPTKYLTRSLAKNIDTILWIAPHLCCVKLLKYSTVLITFNFVYKQLSDAEKEVVYGCCSSLPIQCWRHSLKEVKIEGLRCVKSAAKLKVLFEKSQALERIEGLPI